MTKSISIGDLVRCPVDLETGEINANSTLALVVNIYNNEPKIGVVYFTNGGYSTLVDVWYISEIELISEG